MAIQLFRFAVGIAQMQRLDDSCQDGRH
jgi:hypothetical protein